MTRPVLVCFAVPQEAKPFRGLVRGRTDVGVLLTGMGPRNAARAMEKALESSRPRRVFACGFAGGLDPALKIGTVVFDDGGELESGLLNAGATKAHLHSADSVAVTRRQKAELRRATGADAVDMESHAIRTACLAAGVPCVCVRAISDTADEDLPLDFNALMTQDQRLSYPRLMMAIMRAPSVIPALARLGRNSTRAANELSRVLAAVLQIS